MRKASKSHIYQQVKCVKSKPVHRTFNMTKITDYGFKFLLLGRTPARRLGLTFLPTASTVRGLAVYLLAMLLTQLGTVALNSNTWHSFTCRHTQGMQQGNKSTVRRTT